MSHIIYARGSTDKSEPHIQESIDMDQNVENVLSDDLFSIQAAHCSLVQIYILGFKK